MELRTQQKTMFNPDFQKVNPFGFMIVRNGTVEELTYLNKNQINQN